MDFCGGADIYITRKHVRNGWSDPQNLGCAINSSAAEASPFLVEYDEGTSELYFSSTRPGGASSDPPDVDSDIYVSAVGPDGSLAPPILAAGLNTGKDDARPNLRRDGLEIFFDSTRSGGPPDIWTATRERASDPWSAPVRLGSNVNSDAAETRAWLIWDATTLYFGSTRSGGEGSTDLYVTTREQVTVPHE